MPNLEVVSDALLSVLSNVGHYRELKKKPPYAVWMEDGAIGQRSDNRTGDQALTGTAHLFVLEENSPLPTRIQNAFNDAGISWYLNSVQYEEDTRYIQNLFCQGVK